MQILFKVCEDIGYSFRVLQPIEQLVSLTGTESITGLIWVNCAWFIGNLRRFGYGFCHAITRSAFYENIARARL